MLNKLKVHCHNNLYYINKMFHSLFYWLHYGIKYTDLMILHCKRNILNDNLHIKHYYYHNIPMCRDINKLLHYCYLYFILQDIKCN